MKKRIDSTFYFFQYLIIRIQIVALIVFLIYSIIVMEVGGIIASSLFALFAVYISIKKIPKPADLDFDGNSIHLDSQHDPIEIKNITAMENGVIIYELKGETTKINLPKYYFIDKNYKELKKAIENRSTKTQHRV